MEDDPADYVNGMDADTGRSLAAPPDDRQILGHARGLRLAPTLARDLQWWIEHHAYDDPERQLMHGMDPERLDHAGWGVIWAPDTPADVVDALEPLLTLRRDQAGNRYYPVVRYERGWNSLAFRSEHEIGFGPVDPDRLPYYLLLVGDPRALPFELQYGLDVQYAVGRLHLDSVEDYHRYALSVVERERRQPPPREVAIFDVDTGRPSDRLMRRLLIAPLLEQLEAWHLETPSRPVIRRYDDGRKATLKRLFSEPPGLLFAAAHGLGCPPHDPSLPLRQGALICSDYRGTGKVPSDATFSAADVPADVDLAGLVTVLFACYGAGSPAVDDFLDPILGGKEVAPYPLVSALAKRLLAAGAGAVIGHVDRAWSLSFSWTQGKGDQVKAFDSLLRQMLEGHRLGHALEWIDQRYAEAATAFNTLLDARIDELPDGNLLQRVRRATLDARNYVLLGDPAVRVPGAR